MAASHPIFTGAPVRRTNPSDLYPNVYDSLATARLSSALVDGKPVRKMLIISNPVSKGKSFYVSLFNSHYRQIGLPEEAVRVSNRMMEEITIPSTATPPPPVGEERVRISELDTIAQLAFKGVKTLNRIQSIVFDSAYYSNENLLISAPTGAGKTNIAMLTVLREIKRNMEGGVIQKDKFKVQPFSVLYTLKSLSR